MDIILLKAKRLLLHRLISGEVLHLRKNTMYKIYILSGPKLGWLGAAVTVPIWNTNEVNLIDIQTISNLNNL